MLISPETTEALKTLAKKAEERPVDMSTLPERIKTPTGKHEHMQQMTAQTLEIPVGYMITYSLEDGHPLPVVRARHMSMSVDDPNAMPHPIAVWEIAKLLGFWGELQDLDGMWPEKLFRGVDEALGLAINLVQRYERPPLQ